MNQVQTRKLWAVVVLGLAGCEVAPGPGIDPGDGGVGDGPTADGQENPDGTAVDLFSLPDSSGDLGGPDHGDAPVGTGGWRVCSTVGLGTIIAAAYAPSGDTIAVGTGAGLVQIYSARDFALVQDLPGLLGPVSDIAFSRDGSRLAARFSDGVRIWNLPAGTVILDLPVNGEPASPDHLSYYRSPVLFSRDGTEIFVGFQSTLKVLSVADGAELHRFDLKPGHLLRQLALSADGSLLVAAVGSNEMEHFTGDVIVWRTTDWSVVTRLEDRSKVYGLALSPDGLTLALLTYYGHLDLLRTRDWTTYATVMPMALSFGTVSFSPDGARLAAAGSLYATCGEGCPPSPIWTRAGFRMHGFSPSGGEVVATPSVPSEAPNPWPQLLLLLAAGDGTPGVSLQGDRPSSLSLQFLPDGASLVEISLELGQRTLGFWTPEGKLQRSLPLPAGKVVVAPDGLTMAISGSALNGELALHDTSDGARLRVLAPDHGCSAMAFSRDGKRLACGGKSEVGVWDVARGVLLATHHHPLDGWVSKAWLSADGGRVAGWMAGAGMEDPGQMAVWDVGTDQPLITLPMRGDPGGVGFGSAFSRDGRFVAGWVDDSVGLARVNIADRVPTWTDRHGYIRSIDFSDDGELVGAHLGFGGPVRLWRAVDGQVVGELTPPPRGSEAIAFSGDGRRLAVTGAQTIRVFCRE
jgi:WD40 repeat protein